MSPQFVAGKEKDGKKINLTPYPFPSYIELWLPVEVYLITVAWHHVLAPFLHSLRWRLGEETPKTARNCDNCELRPYLLISAENRSLQLATLFIDFPALCF